MLSTSSIVKAVAAIVLVTWAWKRTTSWRRFQGIPRVGIDPGLFGVRLQAAKNEFFNHGQKLLEQGYERVCPKYSISVDVFRDSVLTRWRMAAQIYSVSCTSV